jgi:cytochrome c
MKPLYKSSLKTCLAITVSVFCLSAQAEVDVDAAKALAKENGCFRCHGTDKDKDGPAWNKVAAKYKGDPKAQEKILQHLASGKNVKFADGHEEAHKILKTDDPKAGANLVDFILSLQ